MEGSDFNSKIPNGNELKNNKTRQTAHTHTPVSLLAGVTSVQRFEQQPTYTEVNPGQNALLSCKVYNKKGTCSWQKDNKVRVLCYCDIKFVMEME